MKLGNIAFYGYYIDSCVRSLCINICTKYTVLQD